MKKALKITGIIFILILLLILPNFNALRAYIQLQNGYWKVYSYDYLKGEFTKPHSAYELALDGKLTSFHFRNDTLYSPFNDYFRVSWGDKLKASWGSYKVLEVKKETIVLSIFSRPYIIKDTINREIKTDVPSTWGVIYLSKMKSPTLHEFPSEIETYIGY